MYNKKSKNKKINVTDFLKIVFVILITIGLIAIFMNYNKETRDIDISQIEYNYTRIKRKI